MSILAGTVRTVGELRDSFGRFNSNPRHQANRAGDDPAEWPQDIRVREFPVV